MHDVWVLDESEMLFVINSNWCDIAAMCGWMCKAGQAKRMVSLSKHMQFVKRTYEAIVTNENTKSFGWHTVERKRKRKRSIKWGKCVWRALEFSTHNYKTIRFRIFFCFLARYSYSWCVGWYFFSTRPNWISCEIGFEVLSAPDSVIFS